ncbi:class I SAM-dependent methyltransferase [Enemella sp. A6]|uniref:class I SAM-dependent methyltransferase n=1 Tax=Enemella sp. A6 TaxID=3440152 RepID=UPI003EC113F7
MGESRAPRSVSRTVLVERLVAQLTQWQRDTGHTEPPRVIDLGGGTGGLAVALAEHGYPVTVVDPSPNALAALHRRAAEHGWADRIDGVQGDAADLVQLFGAGSVDVIACHQVLELLDHPGTALAAIAEALTPGGAFSLAVGQRYSAMMVRALAGDLSEALAIWRDDNRFDAQRIQQMVTGAGLTISAVHGIGVVSAAVSEEGMAPSSIAALRDLEWEVGDDPSLVAAAPAVHLFGTRPD